MEFCGHREIGEADFKTAQVSYGRQLRSAVDVDFCIVDSCQRVDKRCGNVPLAALGHKVRAVLDRGINVGIRRDRDIRLGVATDLDKVTQSIARVVLGVDVAEAVVQPPLSLFSLTALRH